MSDNNTDSSSTKRVTIAPESTTLNPIDPTEVDLYTDESSDSTPPVIHHALINRTRATRSYHGDDSSSYKYDELIPTSGLFGHEVDLPPTSRGKSFHMVDPSDTQLYRLSYTAAHTKSIDDNVKFLKNDPDLAGVEIVSVHAPTEAALTDTVTEATALSSNAALNNRDEKQAFIPRYMLKAPESLQIVQDEYDRGELDQDVMNQRKKAAEPSCVCCCVGDKASGAAASTEGVDGNAPPADPTIELNKFNNNNMNDIDADHGDTESIAGSDGSSSSTYHSKNWLDPFRDLLRSGHKLDQWRATAICANDCISSVLYMTGNVCSVAGVFAPVGALLIAVLLWFFKNVYSVVLLLPLNGGCYNILLNSTRKSVASMAAILTVLSYIATAVVSGTEAVHYIHSVFDFPKKYLVACIIAVLLVFAILNFIGIGESSTVALVIFVFHITMLSIMVVWSVVVIITDGAKRWDTVHANWKLQDTIQPNYAKAIYYGFAAAALGASGFESSSNFISEQRPGVYVKTIRNMHALSSFFNVLMPLFCVLLVDFKGAMDTTGLMNTILSRLAFRLGGRPLQIALCIDAFCVLCGGVLTSYVGVTGLISRLALDRVLPDFFLKKNKWRNTHHFTIFGFFLLSATMYLILNGNTNSLSSTYSIAFLIVMGLFAVGVMLIKINRQTLVSKDGRETYWTFAIIGLLGVMAALGGIVANDPKIVIPFLIYFSIGVVLIEVMLCRNVLLRAFAFVLESTCCCSPCDPSTGRCTRAIRQYNYSILDKPMAFLSRTGNVSTINKAIAYIKANEDCCHVRILHFYQDHSTIPDDLDRNIRVLNEIYPNIRIDLVLINAPFNPTTFAYASVKLNIPRNLMFITTPSKNFKYSIDSLGGCRVIAR